MHNLGHVPVARVEHERARVEAEHGAPGVVVDGHRDGAVGLVRQPNKELLCVCGWVGGCEGEGVGGGGCARVCVYNRSEARS